MQIKRLDDRPSLDGSPDWFTGAVRMDPLFAPADGARAGGARVTFAAGARTHWHTHPLGQTLIVTDGIGRVQSVGGAVMTLRPGDVVWIPPHEKHWHGAAPQHAMTHIAIHEAQDGSAVTWMEPVTDAEYCLS